MIHEEQDLNYEQFKQTAEEIEQCSGCYANPSANAQVDLRGVCVQPRQKMHACGKSLR